MPLKLPDKLPAIELLKKENIFVIDTSRADKQDIRPLKIVILNLMPLKITTETDLIRLLSNTPLQLEIYFMKLKLELSINNNLYIRDPEQTKLGQDIVRNSIILIHELGFENFTFIIHPSP